MSIFLKGYKLEWENINKDYVILKPCLCLGAVVRDQEPPAEGG